MAKTSPNLLDKLRDLPDAAIRAVAALENPKSLTGHHKIGFRTVIAEMMRGASPVLESQLKMQEEKDYKDIEDTIKNSSYLLNNKDIGPS